MKQVTVPEGQSGNWKIEKFTISKKESKFSSLHFGGRYPSPGTYSKLTCNGEIVMSDTQAEQRDHWSPVLNSKGHILINGLGLGMVLHNCLIKDEVTKATIIEKSEDVISLVGHHYEKMFGDKVEIIHADAYEWKPPKGIKYGMVWHDIWKDICTENYEGMKKLHRKYGRRTEWQGSWSRSLVERQREHEKKEERKWGRWKN